MFLLLNGTVKSFDDSKGYGWIVPTDGTKDLFVHQRNILGNDVTTLPIDARVTYERQGSRGDQRIADEVIPVTTSGGPVGSSASRVPSPNPQAWLLEPQSEDGSRSPMERTQASMLLMTCLMRV
ncbi:MAG: cold-shock protein [Actinomycetota bacterium]